MDGALDRIQQLKLHSTRMYHPVGIITENLHVVNS